MKKLLFIIIAVLLQASYAYSAGQYQVFSLNGNVLIEQNGKWEKVNKTTKIQPESKFRLAEKSSIKIKMPDSKLISYDKSGTATLSQIIEENDKSLFSSLLSVLFGDKETPKASASGNAVRSSEASTYYDAAKTNPEETAKSVYSLLKQLIGNDFDIFNSTSIALEKVEDEEGAYHYSVENNMDTTLYFTILQIDNDNNVEFCFRTTTESEESPVMSVEKYSTIDMNFAQFAENGQKSLLLATPYPFATNDVAALFESGTDPAGLNSKNIEILFYVIK